ncbi:putative uncharacterized protein YOR309C isoform X2 [Maniola jurtina]|uniref:putative uncharacterized protein YOR309C isoform X2 n=1 Tax=Maniola jurtina TaxID=191418 RepID=UPI001E686AA0|nr:putative uncharacterized protein YOR309C isoform X2 [Maniola jurtina]
MANNKDAPSHGPGRLFLMHLLGNEKVGSVSDVVKQFKDQQRAIRSLPLPKELAVESILTDDVTLGLLKRNESKLADLLATGMCIQRGCRRRSRCRRRRRRSRSCRRRRRRSRSCRRRRRRSRSCRRRRRRRRSCARRRGQLRSGAFQKMRRT